MTQYNHHSDESLATLPGGHPSIDVYCLSCPSQKVPAPTDTLGYCIPCNESGKAYESVGWYSSRPESVSEREWRNTGDFLLKSQILECMDDPGLVRLLRPGQSQ